MIISSPFVIPPKIPPAKFVLKFGLIFVIFAPSNLLNFALEFVLKPPKLHPFSSNLSPKSALGFRAGFEISALVKTKFSSTKLIKSLFSLPYFSLARTPAPISTAFTPFIPMIASAIFASAFAYKTSPSPVITPLAIVITEAPTLFPMDFTREISSKNLVCKVEFKAKISEFRAKSKSKFLRIA